MKAPAQTMTKIIANMVSAPLSELILRVSANIRQRISGPHKSPIFSKYFCSYNCEVLCPSLHASWVTTRTSTYTQSFADLSSKIIWNKYDGCWDWFFERVECVILSNRLTWASIALNVPVITWHPQIHIPLELGVVTLIFQIHQFIYFLNLHRTRIEEEVMRGHSGEMIIIDITN